MPVVCIYVRFELDAVVSRNANLMSTFLYSYTSLHLSSYVVEACFLGCRDHSSAVEMCGFLDLFVVCCVLRQLYRQGMKSAGSGSIRWKPDPIKK